MKKILQKWIALPAVLLFLTHVGTAQAIFEYQGRPITLDEINTLIESLVNFLFGIGGLLVAGFIVYNGILWATAREDETKVENAKKGLTAAIWGALVIFGIGVILATVRVIVSRGFFNY